jgi:succinate dehydrogenase / fumarate reductase membrane anchor subunit
MSETRQTIRPVVMRSWLGQARGLGSAKSGVAHWWTQRVTAVALVPLSLWFVFSVVAMGAIPRADALAWVHHPVNTVLMICLIVALFHHMQLGLQVVIEDYIHTEGTRVAVVLLMKAVTVLLGLAALISVLRLAF